MREITDYIDVYNAVPDVPDKRKAKIAAIAEALGAPTWEVAETLKAAGCSVNLQWFNQQKRKAAGAFDGKTAAAAEARQEPKIQTADAAYLKKIIRVQDQKLRANAVLLQEQSEKIRALEAELEPYRGQELIKVETAQMIATLKNRAEEISRLEVELDGYRAAADDRAALKSSIDFLNDKIEYYQECIENEKLYTKEIEEENTKLCRQLDLLLHGAAALKDAAGEAQVAPRPTFEMAPVKEYPSCRAPGGGLELADVLNDFCRNLSGVESYLCGRILEALWCWRFNKTADPLRVLGGLVSELIEMEQDEMEATA